MRATWTLLVGGLAIGCAVDSDESDPEAVAQDEAESRKAGAKKKNGALCSSSSQCRSGTCRIPQNNNDPPYEGHPAAGICSPTKAANGAFCNDDASCSSGRCRPEPDTIQEYLRCAPIGN